jgi:CheY-like chemotaxis protein
MPEGERKRRLILVAEDNDDLRGMLRTWLSSRGFDVAEASDGAEAIDFCRLTAPDLILTDLQMPGIDGITAIRHIRRDERLRHIPIIVITAFGDWGMDLFLNIESLGDAPVEYLAKPVSLGGLAEVLGRLLPPARGLNDDTQVESRP